MRRSEMITLAFMAFQFVAFITASVTDGIASDALLVMSYLFMGGGIGSVLYGLAH